MSKFYSILAILVVTIMMGFMYLFGAGVFSVNQDIEDNMTIAPIPSTPVENLQDCDYSDWQTALEERDSIIKQLNQNAIESQGINEQWVEAENQWKIEKSRLEQEILTWQKGSTNFIKLIQQNTLDMIAHSLVDSTYSNSSYNILLRIAQTPLEQELLLKTLVADAQYTCQSLNTYFKSGIITVVPEYGKHCQEVESLFNSLKD